MAARTYKRLPGRNFLPFNSASLWEHEDHLLMVQSHFVFESYRRFFYRDIQAIIICRTKSGLFMSLVPGLIAGALGAPAPFFGLRAGIVLGVLAGLFLLVSLVQLARGPTCRCVLRTAVQTQELPSLGRLRAAHRVLRRIQPKIVSVQQAPPSP